MAVWTMSYTISSLLMIKKEAPDKFKELIKKTNFDFPAETGLWQKIIDKMHLPFDNERNVFLQQDWFPG